MSEEPNDQTFTSKAPTHYAFQVRDKDGGNAIWTRIVGAWQHSDSKGFNIQIDAVPFDGRISLRVPAEKSE